MDKPFNQSVGEMTDSNNTNSEATASYKPLKVHSLEQVMNNHYPEQEYVVDGIVPEASITILSGASRSYKTYTLLHMATSIASGQMLFGVIGKNVEVFC